MPMLKTSRLRLLSLALSLALAPLGLAKPGHYYSCTFNFTGGTRLPFPYCNASLPVEVRVADLLSRMTYEEKSASLDTSNPAIERLGVASMQGGECTHGVATGCGTAAPGSTGCPTSFPSGTAMGATFDRDLWTAVGSTIGTEARALNNQAYPDSSNSDAEVVPGLPPTGHSGIYFLDPNINLQRDPRWGRSQEVTGECPLLNAEFAAHFIGGAQNGAPDTPRDDRYLLSALTAKHFSMYDMEGYLPRTDPEPRPPSSTCDTAGGCQRWNFDASPPLSDFVDYYMPPFRSAVQRAKVASIMCSYNAAFGEPTCASDEMNNQMVRSEWGWEGFFVSDCTALELMQDVKWDNCKLPYSPGNCTPDPFPGGHNYTGWCGDGPCPVNSAEGVGATVAAALVQGGIDYNCGPLYKTNLYNALNTYKTVNDSDIDRAAARIYTTQIKLGMLDPPDSQLYINSLGPKDVDTAASRALSLRAASEAIVLLRNENEMLPLKSTLKLAFIGPHANSTQSLLSNYHGSNTLVNSHSPLLAAQAAGLDVSYSRGCNICDFPYGKNPGFPNIICPPGKAVDKSGFPAAVAAAKAADVAVVFVGSDQTTEAENFDRSDLRLAGVQRELIEAVMAANKKTVVVLINGGPIALEGGAASAPAIMEAFYGGQLGGDAIVQALIGKSNKFGRMPVTSYFANFTERDVRDVDLAHGTGITYRHFDGPVLYPFGFGLSYTSFSYKWSDGAADQGGHVTPLNTANLVAAAASAPSSTASAAVSHQVVVTNTGSVVGDCVVMGFAVSAENYQGSNRDRAGAPLRKLFGFERLNDMAPGESRTVLLSVAAGDLSVVDEATGRRMLVSRPDITLEVGDVQSPIRRTLRLTGPQVVLEEAGPWVASTLEKRRRQIERQQ